MDEVSHVRVRALPFLGKQPCYLPLSSLRILGGHPIHGVDKQDEVSSAFEACRFVFILFLLGMLLEDFGGGGRAIGPEVRVADTDVKDSSSPRISETVGQDVPSGFIPEDDCTVGYGRDGFGGICGIGCSSLRSVAIEDGGFDHDA